MFRLFVRHKVRDFAHWHQGYSNGDEFRAAHDVKAQGVHTHIDDPNDVTVWHDFESREKAEAFGALPELRQIMDELGVQGEPDVWVTETR
ncbi:MAG: hypothetical protein R3E09_00565 [Novosphingobium sp.]|nr:hypothetical protein [Novosphingobium sp.]